MKIQGTSIVLGKKYRDPITGVEGVATAVTLWMHGCARLCIEFGHANKDGLVESKEFWMDTDRAELVEKAPQVASVPTKSKPLTGGPVPHETG